MVAANSAVAVQVVVLVATMGVTAVVAVAVRTAVWCQ
jgi:hypothetical protein